MYIIDYENIRKRLTKYNQYVGFILTRNDIDQQGEESLVVRLAYERAIQLMIESMLDISHLLIDTFMMRDAVSFQDIFIVLQEESVFDEVAVASYHELLELRTKLIKDYIEVDYRELATVIARNSEEMERFSTSIQAYVSSETERTLHNLQ